MKHSDNSESSSGKHPLSRTVKKSNGRTTWITRKNIRSPINKSKNNEIEKNEGRSSLHFACKNEDLDYNIIHLLIEKGSNLNDVVKLFLKISK